MCPAKGVFPVNVKIIKIFIIFIVGSILPNISSLYAGVGVDPTITEIVIPKDGPTSGVFKVANSDSEPACVTVEPEDWLKLKTGKSGIPLGEWLTITPMELEIGARELGEVKYTITPPAGYEGELIAMIFFASSVKTEGAFDITSRFGVSIYAAVEGTIILGCDIGDFGIQRSITEKEGGGVTDRGFIFTVDIENKGNVHLRPTGNILVKGPNGERYDVPIERGFPIYPGMRLNYAVRWKTKNPPPGKYSALMTLDYGNIYGEEKKLEKTMEFFIGENGDMM